VRITSNSSNNNPFDISEWIYPWSTVIGSIIAIICFGSGLTGLGWGMASLLNGLQLLCFVVVFAFVVDGDLEWGNILRSLFIMALCASPGTVIPMIHDYRTSARVEEEVTIETTKMLYSDANHAFVLLIDGVQQPLMLTFGSNNTSAYNHIKAGYLDNTLQVKKKRKKAWHDDEVQIVYEIDGRNFK